MIGRTSRFWLILIAAVGAIVVFTLHTEFFVNYFSAFFIPANDATAHLELGQYYAQNIFPSVWGWAPRWFGGMPFPQFYPPLFYMLMAVLSKIVPWISYLTLFKIVIFILTLSIPGLLTLVTSRFTKSIGSWWITGLGGALLLSTTYSPYDNLGVSLVSTFSVGLVTHLLSFVCFLIWLWAFLGKAESQKAFYISIVFLALSALSNVHIIPVIFIIYIADWLSESAENRRKYLFKLYIWPGLLAVMLTSFWLLPMISVSSFMPSQSLGVTDGIGAPNVWVVVGRWWVPILFLIIASYVIWTLDVQIKKKAGWIIVLTSLVVVLVSAFKIDAIFPNLPLHTYRYLIFFYFAAAWTAALTFDALAANLSRLHQKIFIVICILVFSIPWFVSRNNLRFENFYNSFEKDRVSEVVDYLKDKTGIYTVEVASGGRQLNYQIAQSAPNLKSAYTALVESSINSLFYVPVRSELSKTAERMALKSLLLRNKEFLQKDSSVMANRARLMGISYVLVKSSSLKKVLRSSSEFILDKDFGAWSIYRLAGEQISDAQVPNFEPIVLMTQLGVKGKKITSLNYVTFVERAMTRNYYDLVVARPENISLDEEANIRPFNTVVITDYQYRSLNKAVQNLSSFAERGKLILVKSSDRIYKILKDKLTGNPNVLFINLDEGLSHSQIVAATDSILKILDNDKKPLALSSNVEIKFGQSSIYVKLSEVASESLPVIINSSYFPAWRQGNQEPVYMVTPAFTLIFVKNEARLNFSTPVGVKFGFILSFLALVILVAGNFTSHCRLRLRTHKNHHQC